MNTSSVVQKIHEYLTDLSWFRGLPELKHHLVPRTKGFSFTGKHKVREIKVFMVELKF